MSAVVMPFPIARRRAFIQRQADHASLMNPDSGLRYVEYQLKLQRQRAFAGHLRRF
jgi:hypothetical protein